MPPLIRVQLAPYFPDLDLDAVRLHDGIPRYVRGRPGGYVNRHRIYVASRPAREDDPDWLALIAHELTHVRQYHRMGPWRFRLAYLREYLAGRVRRLGHDMSYRNISFERAARDLEERVRRDFGTVSHPAA
ncbi:MAG: hypothetical protein ABIX37_12885 [Gammaproteobacteria bacterium]